MTQALFGLPVQARDDDEAEPLEDDQYPDDDDYEEIPADEQ